jgi:2-dehydro-3-deoxyphosphooctonate aldolase (KDO 8-P synthase)
VKSVIDIGGMPCSNAHPMMLFGGMNVLESRELAFEIAEVYVDVCRTLDIPYVFKASFDKANRSSITSFRGPGFDQGLTWLSDIKSRFNVPLITDVHEPDQAKAAAEVCDVIQLPAFLSRQTDLVVAMAQTGAIINVKKAQFLAPHEMRHIMNKCAEAGNEQVILCERGSSFGYNNLVVDMLGFGIMKHMQVPVIFDVTHALQKPGGRLDSADGRSEQVTELARSGIAVGLAGLFLESHPDPSKAKCDGPSALPLDKLETFLSQLKAIDGLVKSFDILETNN